MKNYFVSLLIMIVFIVVGAGAASASVIKKVTDVDIGSIELAKSQGVEVTIMVAYNYDYLLTLEVNDPEVYTLNYATQIKQTSIVKPFGDPLYDDHRGDWLNKESLKTAFDTDRQNQSIAYGRLRRVQHRSSAETQS